MKVEYCRQGLSGDRLRRDMHEIAAPQLLVGERKLVIARVERRMRAAGHGQQRKRGHDNLKEPFSSHKRSPFIRDGKLSRRRDVTV